MATKRHYKRRTYRKKKRTQKRRVRRGGEWLFDNKPKQILDEHKLNIEEMKAAKRENAQLPKYVRNNNIVENTNNCEEKEKNMNVKCLKTSENYNENECKTAENEFMNCKYPPTN